MKDSMRHGIWTTGLCLLLCGFLGSGCVVIEQTQKQDLAGFSIVGAEGKPEEHITVSNYGYYLFNLIPICCGNTDPDSSLATACFSDEVNLPKVQGVLINEVKARGCQVAEIQPLCQSTCFFSAIPFIGNSLGIIWYRDVQVSAVLVRPPRSVPYWQRVQQQTRRAAK